MTYGVFAGRALGMPAVAQLKRPLREPSGQLPSASNAMRVGCDAGQRGMQPQTCGTVSPRGGAAPWLRDMQRNVLPAGQVFHGGGGAGAADLMVAPGGGDVPPETNHVRFCASQVYATDPQSPYEQVFPGTAQAPPCAGAASGHPSVRAARHFQLASPGGIATPLHGKLRRHVHVPSG